MNKVIGEFLSNQQPYPQFMATVVYKVRAWGHGAGAPEVDSPRLVRLNAFYYLCVLTQ